jgi:syntaxin 16
VLAISTQLKSVLFLQGLTQAQISQLREQESHAQKRSKEIDNIVKSINDLADLFKELSVLVVEQGSMLDRIDYNIETTVAAVKQGHKELQTAEEYQKSRGTLMCAFMLIVLIFVLFAILVFKWMA